MNPSDYDAFFFESLSNPERHIDRLYAQALLKGVLPTHPRCAQVLEIGCSTGANIIPQAILYPKSHFVGVDVSKEQISLAQNVSLSLGLKNIEFLPIGVEHLNRISRSFDYIICHGLYSWVGLDTQRMLIEQIAHYLSPNGVGYLSYNTKIGWQNCQLIKRHLIECTHEILDSSVKIARARKIIEAALEIGRINELLLHSRTVQFLTYLAAVSDALLLHEYLNPHASGVSVRTLDHDLKAYHLQYFGDARPQRESVDLIGFDTASSSQIDIRQQMTSAEKDDLNDLLRPKSFRAALVVRAGLKEKRVDSNELLSSLYFASPLVLLSQEVDIDTNAPSAYLFMRGEEQPFRVFEEIVARIVIKLTQTWPEPVSGQSLFTSLHTDSERSELLRLIYSGAIEVSSGNFGCTSVLEYKPATSPYVRLQAQSNTIVSTLKHEYFRINDFERLLLKLLDGTKTKESLADAMQSAFDLGELRIAQGQIINIDKGFFEAAVEMALREFTEHGLLVCSTHL
jgi:SAM-dependent methyltransferase/methyltransferase-like protein